MAKRKPTLDEPCLWERQEGESEAAWKAFLAFRDMEGKRTVTAVAKELSKSRQLITRWKATWNWDERVRAFDNDLQKQAHAEAVKGLQEMNKRHTNIAVKMQKLAVEALDKFDASSLSAKDIKEMLKLATELERSSRQSTVASLDEKEQETEAEKETVHIYVPDNGRM